MHVVPYDLAAAVEAGRTSPTAADVCVSINGGAWRGGLWIGLVRQLQAQYTEDVLASWHFCGTSAGACYALALAMNFPAAKLEALLCVAAAKARSHTLGVAFRVNVITGQIIKDMIADVEEGELMRRLRGRFALCFTAFVGARCSRARTISSRLVSARPTSLSSARSRTIRGCAGFAPSTVGSRQMAVCRSCRRAASCTGVASESPQSRCLME